MFVFSEPAREERGGIAETFDNHFSKPYGIQLSYACFRKITVVFCQLYMRLSCHVADVPVFGHTVRTAT